VQLPRPVVRLIARGKPLVPASFWPVLNTAASARGSGPLVADPDPVRTLVLCAHPDDELGCAGTIALLADAGAPLRVVYATRGEGTRGSPYDAEETGRRRSTEAANSCAALGAGEPRFLDFADGSLTARLSDLTKAVAAGVEDFAAQRVLVPWILDGHSDHQAMSWAVIDAELPDSVEVWAFEWWTALVPNRLVDVTRVWARKERAAACHVTAALAFDLTAGLGLSRWRSLHGLHGQGYGEAFIAMPHPEYRALARRAKAVSSSQDA
jgi:LmbE family N-acetylglucosaminyl deacetylase